MSPGAGRGAIRGSRQPGVPAPDPASPLQGEKSFFLQPGERLERGIQDVYVLSEQQGLLLRALQPLEEGEGEEKVLHKAGDHWLIRGPLEYVPSAKVEVVEERQTIPLDENEGIYVQDIKTGKVPAEGGPCHCPGPAGEAEGEGPVQAEGTLVAAERLAGRCEAACGLCAFPSLHLNI